MNFERPKSQLAQRPSHDLCVQVLKETASLYREDLPSRWYFLFLNRVFEQVISNPELHDPDTAEPILEVLSQKSIEGIEALEHGDHAGLISSANQIAEAYCGLP